MIFRFSGLSGLSGLPDSAGILGLDGLLGLPRLLGSGEYKDYEAGQDEEGV